ncbi:MAG: DNRLRE domain-containing protein [Pedosphaera sp.]|nr:DNRLRE domain-containing protein [Pedosphaera sp.]
MKRLLFTSLILLGCSLHYQAAGESVTLTASADTTLHQTVPDNNLGSQFDFAAGATGKIEKTRALIKFDLVGKLPQDATVTKVALTLKVTKQPSSGGASSTFELRRVLKPWGEGTKSGLVGEEATSGEATWKARMHPSDKWSQPGGEIGTDFSTTVSASIAVGDRGSYTFASTADLIADIQQWSSHPELNFGWVLMSQAETTAETARRFGAREDPVNAPSLAVEFTAGSPLQSLRITNFAVEGKSISLVWADGQPPFQVQHRVASNDGLWVAFGEIVQDRFATLPAEGDVAFYRVAQVALAPETAEYEVTFQGTWSAASHPQSFPSGAHWSPLIGGTHNGKVEFWKEGAPATQGIEDVAELGSIVALRSEVNTAISAGNAFNVLTRSGSIGPTGSSTITFTIRREMPLVTLVTMIAPSPDWFTGVHGLPLLENGQWVAGKEVILDLYDSGTDSGLNYNSLDADTQPRERIRKITDFPALVNGQLAPFAKMSFKRK